MSTDKKEHAEAKISACDDCAITIHLPRAKWETIQAFVKQNGESVDRFFARAADEAMRGFAYIAESRIDRFTSDAADFIIVKPAPKKK